MSDNLEKGENRRPYEAPKLNIPQARKFDPEGKGYFNYETINGTQSLGPS